MMLSPMLHGDAATTPPGESFPPEPTYIAESRQGFRPLQSEGSYLQLGTDSQWFEPVQSPKEVGENFADKEVGGLDAVVTRVSEDTVEVQLENSVVAVFPAMMFTDKSLLKYGQPIRYQVKLASNGMRYQAFGSRPDNASSEKRQAVLRLLDSIQV